MLAEELFALDVEMFEPLLAGGVRVIWEAVVATDRQCSELEAMLAQDPGCRLLQVELEAKRRFRAHLNQELDARLPTCTQTELLDLLAEGHPELKLRLVASLSSRTPPSP